MSTTVCPFIELWIGIWICMFSASVLPNQLVNQPTVGATKEWWECKWHQCYLPAPASLRLLGSLPSHYGGKIHLEIAVVQHTSLFSFLDKQELKY